ncbi:hypothetical protein NG819_02720 [Pseudarthrobacter sp. Fe7]|nr:hypothetical protein NG819_02720 [Pseudarthrobacter sp. Fe7]
MESEVSAWAFLRPLLLAVAVAAGWIALSAVGASADSSTSSDPLLGAATSTLGSVTASVTHKAADSPEPVMANAAAKPTVAPASTIPTRAAAPVLRPAVEEVTALTDDVVQDVPVVNTVVPAGTVTSVVAPAVGTVDGAVGATVGAVTPVAGAVLAPLAPVLEPVIGAVPLPVPMPAAAEPTAAPPALPASGDVPKVVDGAPASAAEMAAESAGAAAVSARPFPEISLGRSLACGPQTKPATATPLVLGAAPQDAPFRGPSNSLPGTTGVATGGSSPSGGNGSAMPAWMGGYNLQVPADGMVPVQGGWRAAPAPLSFDPGSSPD